MKARIAMFLAVALAAIALGANAAEKLYCVIDLSGGASASSYPVSYLTEVPSGGWTDEYKTTKLVLRKIDAGTFMMGGAMEATITRSFYIGVFEVTQRQYELVTGEKPSYFNNVSYYATRPVECVSYDDIRGSSDGAGWPASSAVDTDSFLGKIQSRTGLNLDLPTEAQWEYACRAGTTSAYNNGGSNENALEQLGRYWNNGGSGGNWACDTENGTAKVGSYLPNAWGLYDMHGNVWELTLDRWQSNLIGGNDPKGGVSGLDRVKRGGSWKYAASFCSSSIRSTSYPSYRIDNDGFRLCCTAESEDVVVPNIALGFEEYAQGTLLTEENCPTVTGGDDNSMLRVEPLGELPDKVDGFTPPFTSAGTNCLSIKTTFGKPCAFSLKEDKSNVEVSSEQPYCVDFLARFTILEEPPTDVAPYAAHSTDRAMLQSVKSLSIVVAIPGFVCYVDDDIMIWRQEEYDCNDETIGTN